METEAISQILERVQGVLSKTSGDVQLHEPHFNGHEWQYLKECIDTKWVSSAGPFVDRFEQMLAKYTGVKRAVCIVNGTAALHLSLEILGVGPAHEVLVPALTFVASANAVAHAGATPHLVDSSFETMGVDPRKLGEYLHLNTETTSQGCKNKKTGRVIKALIAMHTFGHPVDLDPLLQVCADFKIELVEDAAESLGSFYKGKHTGGFGRLAALSFNGNKIVTTGGGGAILTNDEELADKAKRLSTTSKKPHAWAFDHEEVAYNYRLPNLNAALGCAQMEQLPGFVEKKRALARRYELAFQGAKDVRFFTEPSFAQSNYWLNVILFEKGVRDRDQFLEISHSQKIKARPAWTLMHKLPMYNECPRMSLDVALKLEDQIVNLPSSVFLG